MWWRIGTVAVIIGCIAVDKIFEKKCPCCKKKLLTKNCIVGNEPICTNCATFAQPVLYKGFSVFPEGYYCKNHAETYHSSISEQKSMLDKTDSVITYSNNFKGNVPKGIYDMHLKTPFQTDKHKAEIKLKLIALSHNRYTIINYRFEKGKSCTGNYIYTTWRAHGSI